jgi:hypothetical protein
MTTVGTVYTKTSQKATSVDPFGITDYWHPSFLDGKCDSYEGYYEGTRDATTEWRRKMRLKYNPASSLHHFVSVETYGTVIYPSDYPVTNPFHENYRLLVGEEDCLIPDMMNFYFHGLDYIVQDHKPTGKTFVECTIEMDFITGATYTWLEKIRDIQYGVLVDNEDDDALCASLPTQI